MLFNVVEATDELLVGVFKGIVGVQVVETCSIDDAKQEVAKLAGCLVLIIMSDFGL